MRLADLCFTLFRFLLPPALIATTYLYLYPVLQGCEFPEARKAEAACLVPGSQRPAVPPEAAPFRLLALGDPQLEGDTSLPNPNALKFPSLEIPRLQLRHGEIAALSRSIGPALQNAWSQDFPKVLKGYRKALDLWGNDLYLAHIYRTVHWWTKPTHSVVLGDLLGSQWISDGEFRRRSDRFWNTVFKRATRVPASISDMSGHVEVLGKDPAWERRLITVAGNHDIGYAGDIDEARIERFENEYGQVNWDVRFRLPTNNTAVKVSPLTGGALHSSALTQYHDPELHIVVLNTMNIDEPSFQPHLRQQTLDFLSTTFSQAPSRKSATILLTHVPLHKEEGVCKDAPFFSYFAPHEGGGIREQNHISEEMSRYLLNSIHPESTHQAIVLNGHDHEGCDTFHTLLDPTLDHEHEIASGSRHQHAWKAGSYYSHRVKSAVDKLERPGVREITARSMMGEFSGNAGLLSAWWDTDAQKWQFEYDVCVLGVQHIWWGVHVLDIVVTGLLVSSMCLEALELLAAPSQRAQHTAKVKLQI